MLKHSWRILNSQRYSKAILKTLKRILLNDFFLIIQFFLIFFYIYWYHIKKLTSDFSHGAQLADFTELNAFPTKIKYLCLCLSEVCISKKDIFFTEIFLKKKKILLLYDIWRIQNLKKRFEISRNASFFLFYWFSQFLEHFKMKNKIIK